MMSSGFGHVVNVSSIAGKFGSPSRTSYSAAKFGIIGLMDSLRYEVCTILESSNFEFVYIFSCLHISYIKGSHLIKLGYLCL